MPKYYVYILTDDSKNLMIKSAVPLIENKRLMQEFLMIIK
jgi:hypothetical protein